MPVMMPWPISELATCRVTWSSLSIRIQALGEKPSLVSSVTTAASPGRLKPNSSPPPVAADTLRKSRRVSLLYSMSALLSLCAGEQGGPLDRLADARVGATTTQHALHGFVDIRIRGLWMLLQ